MSIDERPSPRPRGPRPAPLADDPALPPAPPQTSPPAAAPAVRTRRAQPLVQLNTRVAPVLDELVALIVDSRGMSKRDVVEHALRTAYPDEYAALSERAS
jgi:hypothetical protein